MPAPQETEMSDPDCVVLKHDIDTTKDVCLFVTHSSDCTIKPHVSYHVRALMNAGFQVVLICNTDRIALAKRMMAFKAPNGIVVRSNEGFDFGAWADVLRRYPSLWECSRLLFANDSVIGPVNNGLQLFQQLRTVAADMVGLVESHEFVRHFQSFFFMLNRGALQSGDTKQFWHSVLNLKRKTDVIRAYELEFTQFCSHHGLSTRAIFQQSLALSNINKHNPTIVYWRDLTRGGFPYVKVELVRDRLSQGEIRELKSMIADPGLFPFIDGFAAMGERARQLTARTALKTRS